MWHHLQNYHSTHDRRVSGMVSPLVWLADIPEAERDTLLHRLAKGLDTAEGLPATLSATVQKVPRWQLGGQPQPPLPYEEQAYPSSMQPYSISLEYWREALQGRVDVVFEQNAVFCGHE